MAVILPCVQNETAPTLRCVGAVLFQVKIGIDVDSNNGTIKWKLFEKLGTNIKKTSGHANTTGAHYAQNTEATPKSKRQKCNTEFRSKKDIPSGH